MKRIVLLSSVLLLSACGAPSATDAEATPSKSEMATGAPGGDTAGFRDSLNTKLGLLEGRLAIFCFGATDMGSMPAADDIRAATASSAELGRYADDLQDLDPPQGALAVANDAADMGSAITEMVISAALLAADLEAGTIEVSVAEAIYLDAVIVPCDDLFDQIEELREAADVLE